MHEGYLRYKLVPFSYEITEQHMNENCNFAFSVNMLTILRMLCFPWLHAATTCLHS